MKPFADSDLEVSSIEDLFNIPDNLKENALEHLEIKNSILYLWFFAKDKDFNVTKFKEQIKKKWLESFLKRAEEKISSKKFEEAIILLDIALKLIKDNKTLYKKRGYCKEQIGKIKEAIMDYTHAIDLDTKDSDLYPMRCEAYCKIKKYADAAGDCKRALGFNPRNLELSKKMEFLFNKIIIDNKIKFGDKAFSTIEELSHAIDSDRPIGINYLSSGIIEKWLTIISPPKAKEIAAISASDLTDESKISKTIFKLNPSIPCMIDSTNSISSVKELCDLLRDQPTQIFEQLTNKNSDLYNWLEIVHNDYFKKVKVILDKADKNLFLNNTKSNQELIPDIYLTLCGDKIKPFPGEDYEISEVDDILNIHNNYKSKVLKQLKDKNSIIYKWLFTKNIHQNFKQDWESSSKTWQDFCDHLMGKQYVEEFRKKRGNLREWGIACIILILVIMLIIKVDPIPGYEFFILLNLLVIIWLIKLMISRKNSSERELFVVFILGLVATCGIALLPLSIFWRKYKGLRIYKSSFIDSNILSERV